MKLFSNLPGNLRALFGFLRITTLLMAVGWLLVLTFQTWIQRRFVDDSKVMVTFGEVVLQAKPTAVALSSDSATPGSLGLSSLRGTLQANLASEDERLVSVLRQTIIPSMVVVITFCWFLFTALRNLCSNIESGEVFSGKNLRLVRGIGVTLIAYSLASFAVGLWGTVVMNQYLSAHVVMTGLSAMPVPTVVRFIPSETIFSVPGSMIIGLLVLVISEAFRQGLVLKNENDLTV